MDQSYQRGERIFDQCENDIRNLNEILGHENNIIEFFETCKQNKLKLLDQKNDIINKLLRIKKQTLSKEEYVNLKEFWNEKREETKDEKNRRECEEMLEEMTEKEHYIEQIKQ